MFYLDPHVPQRAVESVGPFPCGTFHCSELRSMPMANIDPTLALGFYCRTSNDFDNL